VKEAGENKRDKFHSDVDVYGDTFRLSFPFPFPPPVPNHPQECFLQMELKFRLVYGASLREDETQHEMKRKKVLHFAFFLLFTRFASSS
jgi:hypothetical protein